MKKVEILLNILKFEYMTNDVIFPYYYKENYDYNYYIYIDDINNITISVFMNNNNKPPKIYDYNTNKAIKFLKEEFKYIFRKEKIKKLLNE